VTGDARGVIPVRDEADEVGRRIRVVAVAVAAVSLLTAMALLFRSPGWALGGVTIALGSTQLAGY
jgi:hypothetical protein